MTSKQRLFDPVVPEEKLHPSFNQIRTGKGSICCRMMLEDVFEEFIDPDGNFVEQFQTTGFDHRFFELYLFAYLSRSGLVLSRDHEFPDFIATKGDLSVAIEATTVNPPKSGVLKEHGREIKDLNEEELRHYLREELPMRFGSPLYSKLQKKYWEKDHCKGLPLVFAIEAFHDEDAHSVSDGALMTYLYGSESNADWNEWFDLVVERSMIESHRLGQKEIPSGFFSQPDSQHVSAVLFTNSGTSGKFSRMGMQHGFGNDSILIARQGQCYTPIENAKDPSLFYYSLENPPFVESWGQGLVVMHNPNCINPVPKDFFPNALQAYIENELITVDFDSRNPWHPYVSKTITLGLGSEMKKAVRRLPPCQTVGVMAIDKAEFDFFIPGGCLDENTEEQGWYADESSAFFGTVIFHQDQSDWTGFLFARNKCFEFIPIQQKMGFETRQEARMFVQSQISALVMHSPKRIFDPSIDNDEIENSAQK